MRSRKPTDARSVALVVLRALAEDGAFLQPALDAAVRQAGLDERDRRLAWEIVLGTARWLSQLDDALAKQVKKRPLDQIEPDALTILRLSAYQLMFLDRVPASAVVHTAVDLGRKFIGPRVTGFINGVLRGFLRSDYTPPDAASVDTIAIRYGHPPWLVDRYVARGGVEYAVDRCEANNRNAPLTVRITDVPVDDVLKALAAEGADVQACQYAPDGFTLKGHPRPFQSKSFRSGRWTVQDEGSLLVVGMLTPEPGNSVWDMCAAPGGKTHYLRDLLGEGSSIVATDSHEVKLSELKARFQDTDIDVRHHDARQPLGQEFDRVLLDAPCTAVGLIRRHPEIRWRRTKEDITACAALQRALLESGARHTKPGGLLVYSVCSDLTEEGSNQIEDFLKTHSDFVLEPPRSSLSWAHVLDGAYLRVDPLGQGCDGFFAARLRRRPV